MPTDKPFDIFCAESLYNTDLIGLHTDFAPIFHYTSPEGFLGILNPENLVLWFSQYDSLNDITEGTHVVKIYQNVCDDLYKQHEISEEFFQVVRQIEPMKQDLFIYCCEDATKNIDEDSLKFETSQQFICCFSRNDDSLPMWNYYAKGDKYEGYNIGIFFDISKNEDIQNYYGKGYNFQIVDVIYNNDRKQQIIRDKIKEIYPYYADNSGNPANIHRIKNVLSYFLKGLSLKFKQRCFQHEQEVRAILTIPESNDKFKIKYRNKAGYIIPYVELSFPKKIVTNIMIGPLINDDMAVNNIKRFVKQNGYLSCIDNIRSSEIPIRY